MFVIGLGKHCFAKKIISQALTENDIWIYLLENHLNVQWPLKNACIIPSVPKLENNTKIHL